LELKPGLDGALWSSAPLRERYGFRVKLHATGQVLRDQFLSVVRPGSEAFDVIKKALPRPNAASRKTNREFDLVVPSNGTKPGNRSAALGLPDGHLSFAPLGGSLFLYGGRDGVCDRRHADWEDAEADPERAGRVVDSARYCGGRPEITGFTRPLLAEYRER
jgi:hypothetical protein